LYERQETKKNMSEVKKTKLSRKNAREHLLVWKFMIGAAAKSLPGGRGMLADKILKGYERPVKSTESAVLVSTQELLKMQIAWDEVDCMLQGIIANNIESDLIGVYQEHETALAQYLNIVAIVERATVGNKDEAELKMRCYKQMNSMGEIEGLEQYLSMKQELINQYESILGEKFDEKTKVVWFLKGLSVANFPTWPYEWEKKIENGVSISMVQMLEQARGTDNRRLEGIVDLGRGMAGRFSDDQKETRKCFNCGKQGHISEDCRGPKNAVKCFSCNKEGHRADQCRVKKNHDGKKKIQCYHCKKDGHMRNECGNKCDRSECTHEQCQKGDGGKKGVQWGRGLMARSGNADGEMGEDLAPIDNGSSISGFNNLDYFVPGTLKQTGNIGVMTIVGRVAKSAGIGTARFAISDGNGNWKSIEIENAAYMPSYDSQVISETQFRRVENCDIEKPRKKKNDSSLPMILSVDERTIEILPDVRDHIYYVRIRPAPAEGILKGLYAGTTKEQSRTSINVLHQRFGHPGEKKLKGLVPLMENQGFQIYGKAATSQR
jgi:hypothetical protein